MSRLIVYTSIYCWTKSVFSWQIVELVPPATFSMLYHGTIEAHCIDGASMNIAFTEKHGSYWNNGMSACLYC